MTTSISPALSHSALSFANVWKNVIKNGKPTPDALELLRQNVKVWVQLSTADEMGIRPPKPLPSLTEQGERTVKLIVSFLKEALEKPEEWPMRRLMSTVYVTALDEPCGVHLL